MSLFRKVIDSAYLTDCHLYPENTKTGSEQQRFKGLEILEEYQSNKEEIQRYSYVVWDWKWYPPGRLVTAVSLYEVCFVIFTWHSMH